MKSFRFSFAGGIDAVTDLALGDNRHVLYLENLDLRSGKAVPYKAPKVDLNVAVPTGATQVFAYRNRLLFSSGGRRSYAAQFQNNREQIFWTQYGGAPQKMIEGIAVPLGIARPGSPVVSTGGQIAPQNIKVSLVPGGGNIPPNTTLSFRLAYHTGVGVLPASGSILVVTPAGTGNYGVTLEWSNPAPTVPVSEIWLFLGHGAQDEQFLTALGANTATFTMTDLQAGTGDRASNYDQTAAYQYAVTLLRDVNGIQNESGPCAPTPAFESILARQVTFDPWTEGLMDSPNLVTWGTGQPSFKLIDTANIPGSYPNTLNVTAITEDPQTGLILAAFDGPHAFSNGEPIYIVGLPSGNNPFLNPGIVTVADTTALYAIPADQVAIGNLFRTTNDGKIWQCTGTPGIGSLDSSNFTDVTGTDASCLPVKVGTVDASVNGVASFNTVSLWVPEGFEPPGSGLTGVTAYRVPSVGIIAMDFNPRSGAIDFYTDRPHSFGTELVFFSGFQDPSWNTKDGIRVVGDMMNNRRLFVEKMHYPLADAVSDMSGLAISKGLTLLAYQLDSGQSLDYAAMQETQFGTPARGIWATVTDAGATGSSGAHGVGVLDTVACSSGGACPVLGDVLYFNLTTGAGAVKLPSRVVGVLQAGLLLNQRIAGATDTSGPSYTAGIQFIPYNDYLVSRRLYRAGGNTVFGKVVDLPLEVVTYLDAVPDQGLGDVLPTLYTQDGVDIVFEPAPLGLTGLTQHYTMAFAWDPSSNTLRWTPEGQFDAWPPELAMAFDYRILGLRSFNQALCVFCEDAVYRLDGDASTRLERHKTKAAGCRAGGSIQEIHNRIVYLIDQGLAWFNGQESEPLTDLRIPSEFWLGNSRYLTDPQGNPDPGQYLVPAVQNAALERLTGPDLPMVTPRFLMPYQVDPRGYQDLHGGLRSFVLFGKYYLYWGGDVAAYDAQTCVYVDFSAKGAPIGVIGVKFLDAFVDELNQGHLLLVAQTASGGA
jgi:hypothetical protein